MSGLRVRVRSVLIPLIVLVLTTILLQSESLWRLDRVLYDAHFRLWQRSPSTEIAIVAIDDASLERLGKWPWPREIHAELIDHLSLSGAKAVGMDMLLAEKDLENPQGDDELAAAIKRNGRVVLPVVFQELPGSGLVELLPAPIFSAAALGHAHLELDPDGVNRAVYLRAGLGSARWPALPVAMVEAADPGSELSLPGQVRDSKSPSSPYAWVRDNHVLIPFVGPTERFPHWTYTDVISGAVPPDALADKYVLVGATALGLGNAVAVPVSGPSRQMPGVEVNANILSALLEDNFLVPLGAVPVLLLTGLLVLAPFYLYALVGPVYGAAVAVAGALLGPLVSLMLLRFLGVWFPPAASMLGIMGGYSFWLWCRFRIASKALAEERRRAVVTLESVGDAVLTVGDSNQIEYMNPVAEEMAGYRLEEARGKKLDDVIVLRDVMGADDNQSAISGKLDRADVQQKMISRDGSHYVVRASFKPLKSGQSTRTGTVIAISDITATDRLARRMTYQATHDALTDLPNRSLLMDRLEQSIAQARRQNAMAAILFVDLDRFKLVNDALGHVSGDHLLIAVARRLESCTRGTDTVARVGGDEFVIILGEVQDIWAVAVIARKILNFLHSPVEVDGQECLVSGSIGISIFPRDGEDAECLLKFADIAMYQVKERGRNGFRFYTKEMDQQARERLHLEHELRHAIARNELELHYQPIVTCSDKRITAAEALLRWRAGGIELRNAADFIPVAEESGLVVPIGEWVLAKACAQAKAWSDAGMAIRVDVNLSPRQLYLSGISKTIAKVLADSRCDPKLLGLEITETAMMNDMEVATRTILELKSLGIHISVDDFGVGYSSLSYLKRFPINRLKIDRAFVSGAESDSRDAALATAIIVMAHSMELTATAEGVETSAQAMFLDTHGCDELQGYYFGRPVPASEFADAFAAGSGRAPGWH